MPAPSAALKPTAYVTEIPGRYAPILVVDKRNISGIAASTATSAQMAYLSRAETASHDFNVPLTETIELGTIFMTGDVDDIPENKVTISAYDVGPTNISLLTGKKILGSGTTTFGFQDLNAASVDIIRQYADPNGNIFYSEYMGDHVIEEYASSLKAKAASMESYSMTGFNTAGFRGQIQAKAYIVQTADVSANNFSISGLLGTDEAPYQIPTPSGPASYWAQTGRIYFLKIERWRPADGFVRLKETSGSVSLGYCKYNSGSTTLSFAAGDLDAGDVFLLTYMTYKSDITSLSAMSGVTGIVYNQIPQLTLDTSDPIAVPTRLTGVTIAANGVARGQSLDIKMSLKRDRAEGIGDADGLYGPSDAPAVTLSLDVKMTDASLNGIMENGTPNGSDYGGSTSNDFFSPEQATRNQLASAVALVATINDPRTSGAVLATITSASAVFNQRTVQTPNKGPATVKYSGKDQYGNVTKSVTH